MVRCARRTRSGFYSCNIWGFGAILGLRRNFRSDWAEHEILPGTKHGARQYARARSCAAARSGRKDALARHESGRPGARGHIGARRV